MFFNVFSLLCKVLYFFVYLQFYNTNNKKGSKNPAIYRIFRTILK